MALGGARVRRLIIGALLGAGLLAVFFRGLDWPGLVNAFRQSDPVLLSGVVLMAVITYALRAWRWGYLLAPLARVPLMRLFSITNVGFAAGLVIPRAGEVVRPYLVARHHGLKTSAAFASIILERLFDLITVLALFAAYLYVLPLPAAQKEVPGRALQTAGALAGAGGYGPPTERDSQAVLRDVVEDYVSIDGALIDYGVVIEPQRMIIDEAATRELRASLAREASATATAK